MADKDTFFQVNTTMNAGGRIIDLTVPKVMGIINLTPDSFFSASRAQSEKEILKQAEQLLYEGADFLDLGAYSSRPDAEDLSSEEEEHRLIPAIKIIANQFPEAVLSVDTFRARIAEKAMECGAHLINDISGGALDDEMFETAERLKVPYILMHMKGTPKTMKNLNQYGNMMQEISFYFSEKIHSLKDAGVRDIILDPGFGFAKNIDQNYHLLHHLADLRMFGYPVLAGLSRKSMIWKKLHIQPEEALNGTTVLNTIALQNGANILRVHDVKEAKQAIKILNLLKTNSV